MRNRRVPHFVRKPELALMGRSSPVRGDILHAAVCIVATLVIANEDARAHTAQARHCENATVQWHSPSTPATIVYVDAGGALLQHRGLRHAQYYRGIAAHADICERITDAS